MQSIGKERFTQWTHLELDDMQEVTLTLNDRGTVDEDLAGYFTTRNGLSRATTP